LDSTVPKGLQGAACPGEEVAVSSHLKACLLLVIVIAPSLAQAHAILEESIPPAGASVSPGPLELHLRYNSRIDRGRSHLTLIRQDRSKDTVPIASDGPPDIINAHLELSPGTYVIRWQVLAVDGHITRGDVPLTVKAP
jgi:copper resistance protein C